MTQTFLNQRNILRSQGCPICEQKLICYSTRDSRAHADEILPFTNRLAITNEALRIHPSTGLILERRTPKGGVTLHGKFIAEDTIIGVNSWVVNRDKGIFGDDADEFRPERWTNSDPRDLSRMRTNMFTVYNPLAPPPPKTPFPCSIGWRSKPIVWRRSKKLHWKKPCNDAAYENYCWIVSEFRYHPREPRGRLACLGWMAYEAKQYGHGSH